MRSCGDLETQWATSDYQYDRERTNGGKPPWENGAVWRNQSPMRRAANLHTPVLVSVGERDYRVPMNNALEFWTALQRQHVPSKLVVWPTEITGSSTPRTAASSIAPCRSGWSVG